MSPHKSKSFYLLVQCNDQPGIIHKLTEKIMRLQGNITEFDQVTTAEKFICRIEFETTVAHSQEELHYVFANFKTNYQAQVTIIDAKKDFKMAILVSKPQHCLAELLHQVSSGRIPVTVSMIISNHPDHKALADYYNIDYHYLTITANDKQEQQLIELVNQHSDFLVLARYMQILSAQFIENYNKDIINVHHSLLPAFKGSNPYQQAYDKGVKRIGATAHFVTQILDDGPIIEQDTVPINHRHAVDEIKQQGALIEKKVLAESCRLYAQHRIVRLKDRTIIFR